MLTFAQFEEIDGLLGRATDVIRLQISNGPNFEEQALAYLDGLVGVLERNRMSIAARVAAMRAATSETPPDAAPRSRATRRAQRSAIGGAVREAIDLVHDATATDRARFADADAAARRAVSVAAFKGVYDPATPMSLADVRVLYVALKSDPDLVGGALQVESLVGANDAVLIFDRRARDPLLADAPTLTSGPSIATVEG